MKDCLNKNHGEVLTSRTHSIFIVLSVYDKDVDK